MRRALIVAVAILSYSALYAPQPLLPLLARELGVSESRAGLLISATLLPLSIAPLSYGLLLRRLPPVSLLRAAVVVLGLLQLGFALSGGYAALLALRVAMGLALPAAITATMTYAATTAAPGRVQREMAVYVAASIVGGFAGRALSAVGAAYLEWRWTFVALGCGFLLLAPLLGRLPRPAAPPAATSLAADPSVLRRFGRVYAAVFCLFFAFAGLLNYLPFRLVELRGEETGVLAGLIYAGYLVGVATALGSERIVRWLGGAERALAAGFALFAASLALIAIPDVRVLFLSLFVFCGAMFLVHTLATGTVNRAAGAGAGAGMANAAYLAFYYSGGSLGSYLPGLAYERWGWGALVGVLSLVAVAGAMLAAGLRPQLADPGVSGYS